ncbi:MAG TPA: Asp-tRNA(Asn)/Glu-tRNA(Gln) amidotransferase subunit GatC [Candidatus Pacearchaeota archaeon]|jgi:aspartyl-tRNA(Asn)/glutamyl-tRNA(Gln) amidotransferase subunit C|nr:Asp-tRNA(Asn)/Glu-tRNA(Gln) amidotransferase subunit GatC [Candidatus Pacearchaeota archaeon]
MISKDDVKRIARLSYLDISENELEKFQKDFSDILDYVNQLKELEVANVSETANISFTENVFRKDEEKIFNNREELKNLWPHSRENYLEVKKILYNEDN